ncbi:MAG: efflux RND transporter permease subunit [Chloroflexota bacterium]|jgi:HAE1 family hydrophobic/amphiphilic exporter-1
MADNDPGNDGIDDVSALDHLHDNLSKGPQKMWLSDLSIRQPVFIMMMVAAVILVGWLSYSRMAVDLMPDTTLPIVAVSTVYPGADPKTIERSVTKPIEDAMASLNGVEKIRSTSSDSVSTVIVEFDMDMDGDAAADDVRDRIGLIRNSLPADIQEPVIGKMDMTALPIGVFAISDKTGRLNGEQLRTLADDVVKTRMERLDGIALVEIYGGLVKEVHVELSLAQLQAFTVSPQQVIQAIRGENLDLPAGRIYEAGNEELLRTAGQVTSLEELGEIPVPTLQGSTVKLKELASISKGHADVRHLTRLDGQDSVVAVLYKQSGSNTVKVAESAKAEMAKLQGEYPDLNFGFVYDGSTFTRDALRDVQTALLLGGLLAALVVLLFFRDLRNTLVTIAGLPVVVLGTFAVLHALGISLNMISMMALSMSIGMLIDDAIVVRENIFRHMERGEEPKVAAGRGTAEIALAVLAVTSTIVAVFLPIAFTGGMMGVYLRDFGVTIATAVLISLVEAFTLAPMLSAYLFKKKAVGSRQQATGGAETRRRGDGPHPLPLPHRERGDTQNPEPRTQHSEQHSKQDAGLSTQHSTLGTIYTIYRGFLSWSLSHRKVVVGVGVLSLLGSLAMVPLMNQAFMQAVDQGEFSVMMELRPGARLEESDEVARTVEELLRNDPMVSHIFTTVGSSGQAVNSASVGVILKSRGHTDQMITKVRDALNGKLIGTKVTFNKETAAAGALGSAMTALMSQPIQFKVQGNDIDQLDKVSIEVMERLSKVSGVVDIDRSIRPGRPGRIIVLNRARATDLGVSTAQVGTTIRTLVNGEQAGSYMAEEEDMDIMVRLAEEDRYHAENILKLPIASTRGSLMPLSAVASLAPSSEPHQIERENRMRQVIVGANYQGNDIGPILAEAQEAVAAMQLPEGVMVKIGGDTEYMDEAFGSLSLALVLSVLFMYMILASQFGSLVHPFTIMLALPFSIIGALLALLISRISLDAMAMIGMLLLMGLVTKNSILLVEFINQLKRRGMSTRDAILQAGPIRLRPILMTTFAMIFGMMPVAVGFGAGSELRQPMGVTVVGGVITSTILTLIVVPVAYSLIDDTGGWIRRRLRRTPKTVEPTGVKVGEEARI